MNILNIRLITIVIAVLLSSVAQAKNDKQDKPLPPGLEKKVERGGELPPGWQKKLHRGEILDLDLYHYGIKRPGKKDDIYEWVEIESDTVKIIKNTREIVEILTR
ncbi:hypothetical protein Q4519_14900 [Motilimonas sp. 1_MG-2023]|nr:hypothetical protein [Motilimonas sp. 1_MG-2023]MCE0558945.1 hypothetical protein [Motilimonas sp. E26]MDO6526973.1 hypothetical protein [Motilimonas sp. 1_MG-2023]